MNKFILLILGITIVNAAVLENFLYELSDQAAEEETALEDVQDIFNGFWEQEKVQEPAGLADACFDSKSASHMLGYFSKTLKLLKRGELVTALGHLEGLFTHFRESNGCLEENPSSREMFEALGLTDMNMEKIKGKIAAYVVNHGDQVQQMVNEIETEFVKNNFEQAGRNIAVFVEEVLNYKSYY